MMATDTVMRPPSPSAYQNWDGTYRNLPGTALNQGDFDKLASRGIPRELGEQALLRRVTSLDGANLVGRNGGGDYSGIAIPYVRPGETDIREYRLRRDKPDLEGDANGRLREKQKYLSPPGRGNMLYFVPDTPVEWLSDITLPLAITEGEFKAMALWRLAFHSTDGPAEQPRFCPAAIAGVWNWRGTIGKAPGPNGERLSVKGPISDLDSLAWKDRVVYLIFDANVRTKSKVKAARDQFADELAKRGARVRYVEVPDVQGVNGIDDLVGAWGPERTLELFATTNALVRTTPGGRPASQATTLVHLVEESCVLYHTSDQMPFAEIKTAGHVETWPVQSAGFRNWMLREYFTHEQRSPAAQALGEAISTITAMASFNGKERELSIRVAQSGGRIYLDLCDEQWRVVEISSSGWNIVATSPVAFRRVRSMLPLPAPVPGRVKPLKRLFNFETEKDWTLCLGWLIGTFRGSGPYPILALHGEQGTAKTFMTKMLRTLIDPSHIMVRSMPRDERDLYIAASNAWVLGFDNISAVTPWQSDALCRISTGSGFGARKLFSDGEEAMFQVCRPMILNGIESLTERADLADRAIVLELPPIEASKRRLESELWDEFKALQPSIFGGLCDAVAMALGRLGSVKIDVLPRMADFALWGTAAEPALELESGEFMEAYAGNRESIVELTLEGDSIASPLRMLMADTNQWVGTATKLLAELESVVDERVRVSQRWPGNGKALSGRLNRIAAFLRAAGIDVSRVRGTGGQRLITIRKTAENCVTCVTSVTAGS